MDVRERLKTSCTNPRIGIAWLLRQEAAAIWAVGVMGDVDIGDGCEDGEMGGDGS